MSIQDREIPELKIGDVIYECEMGMNAEVRITSEPVDSFNEQLGKRQWRWTAENTQTGAKVEYLSTEGFRHYGPHLYRRPQYSRMVDGQMTFPLVGA